MVLLLNYCVVHSFSVCMYIPNVADPLSVERRTVNSVSRTSVTTGSRHTERESPSVTVNVGAVNLSSTTVGGNGEREREREREISINTVNRG